MTTELGDAYVRIRPDTKGFGRELGQQVETETRQASFSLFDAVSIGATVAGAKRLVDAASGLQQAVGGTSAVFGEASSAIDEFASTAAESAGLSERAAREATSAIGAMLQGAGFAADEAAKTSVQLTKLAADLSATFGGRPEEAVQALGAALRGETDPLERFGIALNQTAVNAKAVELGLADSTSSVDQNAKAQATLALITERSAAAQGQFAREADTAAGQAAIAAAKSEDAAADLGESLLPIYTKLAEAAGVLGSAFAALPDPVQSAILALAGLALVAGPTSRGVGQMRDAVSAMAERAAAAGIPVEKLGGALGVLGGTAAGVVGLATVIDLLGDQINDGRFGRGVDDVERLNDSLARLARGQLAGALADDLQGLTDAFLAVELGKTGDQLASDAGTLVTGLGLVTESMDRLAGGSEEAEAQLDKVDKALAELIRLDPAAGEAAFRRLTVLFGESGITAERVRAQFDDTSTALSDLESGVLGAARELAGLEGPASEAIDTFEGIAGAIKSARDELDKLDEAVFGQKDAQLGLQGAQLDAQDAALGLTAAQQDVNDALAQYGPNSREVAEAVQRRERAELDLQRAQLDVTKAQQDLNQATRDQADIITSTSLPALIGYRLELERIAAQSPLAAGGIGLVNEQLAQLSQQIGAVSAADALGAITTGTRNLVVSINAGRGNFPPLRPGG